MKGTLTKKEGKWYIIYNPFGQGQHDNFQNMVKIKPLLPNIDDKDLYEDKEVEFRYAKNEYVILIQQPITWSEIIDIYTQTNSNQEFTKWLKENFNPPSKKY